jgi:hypothetical protein
MRKKRLILCGATLVLLNSQLSQAAVQVASWDFESSWTPAASVTIGGTGSSYLLGTPSLDGTINSARKGGQIVNAVQGTHLTTMEYTKSSPSDKFILKLKAGSGYTLSGFTINYDVYGNNASSEYVNSLSWAYSTDGGATYSTPTSVSIGTAKTWNSKQVSWSSLSVASEKDIWFRATFAGEGKGYDLDFFDSFVLNVEAVPEPVNVALATFGLGLAVVLAGRRVYRWVRT